MRNKYEVINTYETVLIVTLEVLLWLSDGSSLWLYCPLMDEKRHLKQAHVKHAGLCC